ncbi:MAG: hypothetical protein Tsb009_04020 [Planctomycetaceae bacterium]
MDPPCSMSNPNPADERRISVESIIAHLQHDIEQLSQVVLRQQAEIDELKLTLEKLESRIDKSDESPENRDLEDERPPHY